MSSSVTDEDDEQAEDYLTWLERFSGEGQLLEHLAGAEPGQTWCSYGDPIEVLVGYTEDSRLLVGRPGVQWNGPAWPKLHVSKIVEAKTRADALPAVKRIRRNRLRTFRRCYYCNELNPPEWFERTAVPGGGSEVVCHSCCGSKLGMVF